MDGIIIIDKPQNMTSFDVVNKVKRITRAKVGHSGTLDPMATGVLVIATNRATKALSYLGIEDKVYHASMTFGTRTHTGDIWGEVLETQVAPKISIDSIQDVLKSLIGKMEQRVPKVSAKKVDGKRSYQYVLDDEEVKQLYTSIEILSLDFISFDGTTLEFVAKVSNGTYIRTLCEDIAEKLGTIGTMTALRRTQVGKFSLENAVQLEELSMMTPVIPIKDAIDFPKIVDPQYLTSIRDGKRIELETEHDEVLVDAGAYYAIYEREEKNTFKSVRGLW